MPSKIEKEIGRQVLEHANNDRWEPCLSLLRHDHRYKHHNYEEKETTTQNGINKTLQIWLHGSTAYGDHLVHLCAFAACEKSLPLHKRKLALYCLKLVLDWEGLKASQRVAGDGGTALHGAIASASSAFDGEDDADDDEESDENNQESDEDQRETLMGTKHIDYFKSEIPKNLSQREEELSFFAINMDDNDLILQTITMLLDAGSDPNAKLVNILDHNSNFCPGNENNDDDDDEIELNYAREAIIHQWNPIVMVIVWIGLQLRKIDHLNHAIRDKQQELPFSVLSILIKGGADPSYEVGNQSLSRTSSNEKTLGTKTDWRPIEFAAICLTGYGNENSSDIHVSPNISTHLKFAPWERVQNILINEGGSPPLNKTQSFIFHILNNDIELAQKLQMNSNYRQDYHYPFVKVQDHFPLPKIIFGYSDNEHQKTLIEYASYNGALDSVNWLLLQHKIQVQDNREFKISESLCRSIILALFASSASNSIIHRVKDSDNIESLRKNICTEVIDIFCLENLPEQSCEQSLEINGHEYSSLRQQFLDKLLLSICATRNEVSTSVEHFSNSKKELFCFVLSLGADPNIKSIINTHVHGKQSPLHILAGNLHNSYDIEFASHLLSVGSCPNSTNADGLKPIQVALICRNYRIAKILWNHHLQNKRHNSTEKKQQNTTVDKWLSLEEYYYLCLAALDRRDIEMFEYSINSLKKFGQAQPSLNESYTDESREIPNDNSKSASGFLGKILLLIIDSRSGCFPWHDNKFHNINLMKKIVIDIILFPLSSDKDDLNYCGAILPSLTQDDVTQKTVLHLLLANDRVMGKELRLALLRSLCKWATIKESMNLEKVDFQHGDTISTSIKTPKFISTPCHSSFGGYTPLHLAYSIGCMESVDILLEFGADKDRLDAHGNSPFELLQH